MHRLSAVLLFCLMGFGSFSQEGLKYRWQFQSIENEGGSSLLEIDSQDYFELKDDGTFVYELKAKDNLYASGTWELEGKMLVFKYEKPNDTIRKYALAELNDSFLVINENDVNYSFYRKIKGDATVILSDSDDEGIVSKDSALPLNYDFTKNEISLLAIARGILGISVLVFLGFLMSKKRRSIHWSLIIKGLIIQIVFAVLILKVPFVRDIFDWLSSGFVQILKFTEAGSQFLFGGLISNTESFGYIFAFQVLPTVIFFSALTSLLFYYGVLQKVVFAFAWVMRRTMKLSGAESLSAAGNIFLGQTESPLLVKPYIQKMTDSELLCLMSGGMATIAGGVLAAYIGFLGGGDDVQAVFFAKHLLAASVMSAPAAIVAAKLLLPETGKVNEEMKIEKSTIGSNALEAIANGTTTGLKLAVNVGAMLLVFIALMAFLNGILGWVGDPHQISFFGKTWLDYQGFNDWVVEVSDGRYKRFSFQFLIGYILAPLSWLMGVVNEDIVLVGQLLGEKTILNEFVAYVSLGDLIAEGKFTSEKSIVIATYILCGFSNFASIGIQIGGIGSLAPGRKGDLSRLGFYALIGGTLASLFTAVIVGMLI